MGKKGTQTVNTKVAAAQEQQAKLERKRKEAKDAEVERQTATEWNQGADLRGAKRQDDAERKQLEKMAKAAEKKKLEDEEAAALISTSVKKAPKPKKKAEASPWEAALQDSANAKKGSGGARERAVEAQRQREAEQQAAREAKRREAEAMAKAMLGMVVTDHMATENRNRDEDAVQWASGIDAALGHLTLDDAAAPGRLSGGGGGGGAAAAAMGRNPNMKALYRAFEDREMMRMRQEFPGLKLSQYKDRIWELWRRSPENPQNARAAAATAAGGDNGEDAGDHEEEGEGGDK